MGRERRAYEGKRAVSSQRSCSVGHKCPTPFFQSKSTVESLKEKKMLFTFGTYVTKLRLIDVVDTRV